MDIERHLVGLGHLIDGEVVSDGQRFDVIAPWNGRVLARCPAAEAELLEKAVRSARRSQQSWAADSEARRSALANIADRLDEHADDLGTVNSAETGKPLHIGVGEIRGAAEHARWYARQSLRVDTLEDSDAELTQVIREPVGVVAAIVPWNGPILMLINKIAASIATGNTVIAKSSPFTPLTSLLVGALLRDLVPAGTVNILAGGDVLGKAMTAHPDVNMVAFTGSVDAGRDIMAAGAPTLKRMLLELGGNDAAVVLSDADLETAIPKLYRGAFALSGQICAAIKRLYVHESIFDDVVEGMAALALAAKAGTPWEDGVTMGPLTTKPQFDRVCSLMEDALQNGGRAVTGGKALDKEGFFIPPTIITGVDHGVRLVDEEQFGPVLPIMSYRNLDEVMERANATEFGLGGSIWTADVQEGLRLAGRLRTGGAWVNRHPLVGASIPFGGAKQSGLGREGGQIGLDAFCELKTVSVLFS
ncbi:aldehyde dehydrogenase family protein [Citricoccus sp. K5]|uniref:aldehyde dehydrogenase family protein n=1 Tax=Citricoccus sp. K5 TaxID=2653135 RepID=UPI001359A9FA|nr:aldehyde dehydrogenase family protein [Citricoccus sp. K5]